MVKQSCTEARYNEGTSETASDTLFVEEDISDTVPVEADMSDTVAVELVETDIPGATLDEPLEI